MADIKQTEHPLYIAAVGFMVVEKQEEDSWNTIATFAAANGADMDALMMQFGATEKQVKKDFKVGSMPTRWRTAKSAAINALRSGVPLLKEDGTPFGKTEVEKATEAKAAAAGTPKKSRVPKNVEPGTVIAAVAKATALFSKLEKWTPADHEAFNMELGKLAHAAVSVPYA